MRIFAALLLCVCLQAGEKSNRASCTVSIGIRLVAPVTPQTIAPITVNPSSKTDSDGYSVTVKSTPTQVTISYE